MSKKSKKKKRENLPNDVPKKMIFGDSRYIYWAGTIIIILFTVFIRLRLLEIPLERDEGEFAYMGQLMLEGIPPYLISYNLKLPGIYSAYALIMLLFGQSAAGIHLGLVIINVATIILVFLIAIHLFNHFTGLVAAASFAILSLSPTVLGTSAHATHFVLLLALSGLLIILKSLESGEVKYIFWSGVFLGSSFLMKQPGIFFAIFAFLYILFKSFQSPNFSLHLLSKRASVFLIGAIIPFAVTCGSLYIAGVFDKFWFWTFSYASQYVSLIPPSKGFKVFLDQLAEVVGKFYLLWGITILGIGFLLGGKIDREQRIFVLGFLVFSLLALCPGLYFRRHYFILLLPAVSLLIGIGLNGLKRSISSLHPKLRFVPILLFIVFLIPGLFHYRLFFFEWTPFQACRAIYGRNPFPESIEVARYIRTHSQKEDKIAVFGSEPQIYFYANRHSATGYIYMYSLMEDHKYALQMQNEMIEEVEKAKPNYLVFVNVPYSWLARPGSERYIIEWFDKYYQENLDLVGVVDIISSVHTEYRWGDEARSYSPQSPYFLHVFKRKRI
jgi:Dolichyl-phosphate-mannose-protein mannosyltransferase